MNRWELEVQQSLLNDEKEALEELERQYERALKDIGDKVKQFSYDINLLDSALEEEGLDADARKNLQSRRQAKVYQKQYQDALQGQISDVLDKLHADEFATLDAYLTGCYDNAFMGTLYNIQKQGIPLMLPINQASVVQAVLLNSKLSAGLYARLGIDLQQMKTDVSREVTRGVAANMQYKDIARNIKNVSGVTLGRGKLIARTEGHRIQQQANYDSQHRAKNIGADVVKQWDAALDSRTRESHVAVDGEIREIDKPFSNGLMYPGDPAGAAAEVCNCRCTSNTRARWALSSEQTKWLGDVSEMTDKQKETIAGKLGIPADELDTYSKTIVPLNAKSFDDFKEKYKALQNPEDEKIIREAEERIAGYRARKSKNDSGKMAASTTDNDWSKTTAKTISQKDKQEIIRFAKDSGITVGNIDSFDGDPELLKSEIATIGNTCKKYGIKTAVTVNSEILDDEDFAILTDGNTITFNSKALRQRAITEANITNGERFASKVLEDIALHETGHIFEQENNVNAIEIAKKAYYNINGKHVSTKMIKTFLPTVVSRYSALVQNEIISEVIVAHKNNPNEFTKEFVSLLKGEK